MNDAGSKNEQLTLELLGAIEKRSDISQRHLSAQLGIALGLTNSYLKRCARKGYVKIQQVPANRYLYYLTPKGFAEKSRLTAQFLSTSLAFYRQSSEACSELFRHCEISGWRRIVLCGASDLAEIAYTQSAEHPVSVMGVYDPNHCNGELLYLPVWRTWSRVDAADAFMVTDLDDPLAMYRRLIAQTRRQGRVLTPRVLGLDAAINNSR